MILSNLDQLDGIFYINLEHRKDRKEEIERELKKIGLDLQIITRFNAVYDELNGIRACAQSHANTLSLAIERKLQNVLVLEDDCTFIKNREDINLYLQEFTSHYQNNWDVLFLGTWPQYTQKTTHKKYTRILFSLRATAYIVNGHYLETLRNFYLEVVQSMGKDLFFNFSGKKSIDRRWHTLQIKDRWYSGLFPVALQRESYSDIERILKPQR